MPKILSEIAVARDLLQGASLEQFPTDERTARAISMTLINIGEFVKDTVQDLRDTHREIPWRAIAGMRDVTAHKYQTLRREDVFSTCKDDLPAFEKQIEKSITEDEKRGNSFFSSGCQDAIFHV